MDLNQSPDPAPPWPERLPSLAGWLADRIANPGRSLAALGGAAAAIALVILLVRPQSGPPARLDLPRISTIPGDTAQSLSTARTSSSPGSPTRSPTVPDGTWTVHVAGAVTHPGVYILTSGARVADALAAAGGPNPEADLDRLNLAALVGDAQRVWVPRVDDPPNATDPAIGAATTSTTPALVDLNSASLAELDALPGVGPATAQAILSYRDRSGPFRSVDQLLEVPGIGPAKLDTLRPLVTT